MAKRDYVKPAVKKSKHLILRDRFSINITTGIITDHCWITLHEKRAWVSYEEEKEYIEHYHCHYPVLTYALRKFLKKHFLNYLVELASAKIRNLVGFIKPTIMTSSRINSAELNLFYKLFCSQSAILKPNLFSVLIRIQIRKDFEEFGLEVSVIFKNIISRKCEDRLLPIEIC